MRTLFLAASVAMLVASATAPTRAVAQDGSVKDAFEATRELGTTEAWNAFLASYPDGFYAELARAYLKKLSGDAPAPSPIPGDVAQPAPAEGAASSEPAAPPAAANEIGDDSYEVKDPLAETAAPSPPAAPPPEAPPLRVDPTDPAKPAVTRGGDYMGFPEQFNRYYTDPDWKPTRTVHVSPDGGGDGSSTDAPAKPADAVAGAQPGDMIRFAPGQYRGCFEFGPGRGGTYDDPIVLYAERNSDGGIGVSMNCCAEERATCFNAEAADYIAVDGFELIGGKFGVRAVGAGYEASKHGRGIAVMNCVGHDQDRDPFFTGQVDWAVWERLVAYGAKEGDGHGIYLSNGGDWNIVRFSETYDNVSSDFQINADPASTCAEPGIPYNDPACDAYAGEGEGGRGASDYFLIDGNYFHRSDVGPNFTSVRRSLVRNNVFGHQTRHNVSFWQETDNPKLGSSQNIVVHNLFITRDRLAVQFINHSTDNLFANNLIVATRIEDGQVMASPYATLMVIDETVGGNTYRGNVYIGGKIEGREPGDGETALTEFSPGWFRNFAAGMNHDPNNFAPTQDAPYAASADSLPSAPTDRNGVARNGAATPGPIEPDAGAAQAQE